MSFGKLYSYKENPRTTGLLAIAKENGLDVELVETRPGQLSAEYKGINPLEKIPTFVAADGTVLTECIAIAVYLTSQNDKTALLGKTKADYAQILKWLSFANSELLVNLGGWFRPLAGLAPYNKKTVEECQAKTLKIVGVLESHFSANTFLVTERISLADIFLVSVISRGFQFVFDKAFRSEHPNTTRWFELIVNQPLWKAIIPEPIFIEEAIKYTPPKKEEKPKKAAAAPAPKAAAAAPQEEEEPAPAAPKAKHPCEALGKPTLILDDWKRKYSNEETREVALPWFWENYKPEEYSLWRVDYKYNDELTLTFMSANLIGGFFARLEASRKYIFGAASVYGKSNDSIIRGAFLIRGQDALACFDVAPDWESYSFSKLDPSKPEDKTFIEDEWSWDKAIEVEGKTYDWADGKVFK